MLNDSVLVIWCLFLRPNGTELNISRLDYLELPFFIIKIILLLVGPNYLDTDLKVTKPIRHTNIMSLLA